MIIPQQGSLRDHDLQLVHSEGHHLTLLTLPWWVKKWPQLRRWEMTLRDFNGKNYSNKFCFQRIKLSLPPWWRSNTWYYLVYHLVWNAGGMSMFGQLILGTLFKMLWPTLPWCQKYKWVLWTHAIYLCTSIWLLIGMSIMYFTGEKKRRKYGKSKHKSHIQRITQILSSYFARQFYDGDTGEVWDECENRSSESLWQATYLTRCYWCLSSRIRKGA